MNGVLNKCMTSSPHYAQSNEKAENAVKTAKSLVKKAKLDANDPLKDILEWRNTPTEGFEKFASATSDVTPH